MDVTPTETAVPATPSARLRALRISRGLSIRDAAKAAGVPASSWQTSEEGSLPNASRAVQMAASLGATVEAIWGESRLPVADDAANDVSAPPTRAA